MYLFRWQLSTPILAICIVYFAHLGETWSTIIANLIGGLIFFWIDRYIFTGKIPFSQWHVKENYNCDNCGKLTRCYRLIKTSNYDKSKDIPIYLCEQCSIKKANKLKSKGIEV